MGKGKEKETLTPEERLQAALVSENEQPYKVPENWCWTRIVKLCSLSNGKAFKPTDWSKTGIPIVRIQNLNNPEAEYNLYSGTVEDKFRLCGGELLFAWSGTPGTSFGAHIWWGKEAALNQHIFRVDFDEKYINKVYFKYAINQQLDMLISVAHGGAGLQHVTKGVFEATPIPIPPFAEQQRIVPQSYQMQLIPLTGTITKRLEMFRKYYRNTTINEGLFVGQKQRKKLVIHNFKVALQKLLKGDFIRARVIFLGTLDSVIQRKKFEKYITNELSL